MKRHVLIKPRLQQVLKCRTVTSKVPLHPLSPNPTLELISHPTSIPRVTDGCPCLQCGKLPLDWDCIVLYRSWFAIFTSA